MSNSPDKVDLNLLDENQLNEKYDEEEIKHYKRRWIILSIFIYYGAINSFQWIEYPIIANIVMRYYNVSSVAVDWTSIIYMALYSPLVIPASYIIDKKGLRTAALIGGLGTALGTFIKVFSIGHGLFWVVLLGQGILSASQLLILCLPPRIAAVWFRTDEVSTACSLGVFGTQVGCAIGFLIPPMMVKNHENIEDIGHDLNILCWALTASVIPGAIAVIFYFPPQPPKPPSITQVKERSNTEKYTATIFFNSIKILLINKGFGIHMLAYGINVGVFSAIGTLLNQFILQYFENAEEDAGRMGLLLLLTGIIGSIIFGILLDRTHKYKETTFFTYLFSTVSLAGFMYALELQNKLLVYLLIGVLGFFSCSYMPVGFELAMELTYPSPESTTTGILMAVTQILGVIFTLLAGQIKAMSGSFNAIASQVLLLAIGTIITGFVPNHLKRQEAFEQHKCDNKTDFVVLPQGEKETIN